MSYSDTCGLLRKALAFLLLLCIGAIPSGCNADVIPGSYEIGLQVTETLGEMLQSRDYLEMFLTDEIILNRIESDLNTGDYGTPVAAYCLKPADPREWIPSVIPDSEMEKMNTLSPALQEQLWGRLEGVSYAVNMINAKKGTEILAVSSVLQVLLKKPELEPEETEYLLYVFEKGMPVLVTIGYHAATGMILALDPSDTGSPDSLQEALQPFVFEVLPFTRQQE